MSGRYKAYPEYKNSGEEWIGEIPPSWKILRGKFMFREISERSEQGSETLLSVSEYYGVKPRGEVVEEGDFLSRAESLEGYKKCQVNDLVMNIMLAWKRGLGVSKFEGIVSPAYSVFRFFESANPDYMHYLLRTDLYTGHFKTRSTGVIDSRLRLYPDSFFDTSLIVPPLPEQTQIAAFLDHETAKIDRLIEKQQGLIALLKEKRQAVISHAVTQGLNPHAPRKDSGIEWLGQVPAHWELLKGNWIGRLFGSEAITDSDIRDEGEIPFIKVSTLSNEGFELGNCEFFLTKLRARQLSPKLNYIVFPKRGAAIFTNKVNIVKTDSIIDPNLMGWEIGPKALPEFIAYLLKLRGLKDIADVSTVPQINNKHIEPIKFPIPPKDEQVRIIDFLGAETTRFGGLISNAENAIDLMQERRTALISAAVTGKIDVRAWQPPVVSELVTTATVTG